MCPQAGNIINLDPCGYWTEPGKEEQKIVFIGTDLDKEHTTELLSVALVV
jgi:G3E family GTPase